MQYFKYRERRNENENKFQYPIITSNKEGRKCVCLHLSVCLLARLLKKGCMDLDEMLHVDRFQDMDKLINF